MTVTVCFDALGTCFSLDPVIRALDEVLGDKIREAGSSPRSIINDWFHSAQRDYTYRSITSPPPPPISRFLTLSLPRALTQSCPSLSPKDIPDLSGVTSRLAELSPQPGLIECFKLLKNTACASANILIITNGTKGTTEGYVQQAGLDGFVDSVRSCDEVGLSKPFSQVYQTALDACVDVEVRNGKGKGQEREDRARWFVAAHMWDLAAARKAGFHTAYVLAEQPPNDSEQEQEWWELWGGKPDIIGTDLAEVAKQIIEATK